MLVAVAATVHKAKSCAQGERCFEATGLPSLNAQSPSERLNGDWAFSYATLNTSDRIFRRPKPGTSMDSRRYRGRPNCYKIFQRNRGNG
jgi:hypothetical protein